MKLKDISIEELELMSYTDLTYALLKEHKKSMSTAALFREICDLLEYSDSQYASKIGDYYTSLTLDKRFVLLDNNEWDVSDNHSISIVMDDDEADETDEEMEDDSLEESEEVENTDDMEVPLDDEDVLDDEDDDLDDLEIVDEDDLEEE